MMCCRACTPKSIKSCSLGRIVLKSIARAELHSISISRIVGFSRFFENCPGLGCFKC